jgi:glycine/D-amino acid oxidase-like deaminating enzyme
MPSRSLLTLLSVLALTSTVGDGHAAGARARAAGAAQARPVVARGGRVAAAVRPARAPSRGRSPKRLVGYARALFAGGATAAKVRTLHSLAGGFADERGRATDALADALRAIDRAHGDRFDTRTTQQFQRMLAELGVTTHRKLELPLDRTPYWLRIKQPYADFRSRPTPPTEADVVIVGAGLTGASTAYHLAADPRARGLKVVVVEAGDPGNEASGKNGGNFEIMPENFLGVYEGLERERFKYLKKLYPTLDDATARREAANQATAILRFTTRNRARFVDIVRKEKLEVDFSPRGWLRIAETATEEQGIADEVALGRSLGLDIETVTPAEIKARTGIDAVYGGRLTNDGNYHPFKYVNGLLGKALDRGVELYARTPVRSIARTGGGHLVQTARGPIRAKKVIVATNAFTRELLPELAGIEPWQSQVMITEHAPVTFQGLLTRKQGDVYVHYRDDANRYDDRALAAASGGKLTQRAPFLTGGGLDRPFKDAHKPRVSRSVFETMIEDRDKIAPGLKGQPPSQTNSGPMAFTRDRLPVVGELEPGLFVAAGFNGYGGSYTTAAGEAGSAWAIDGGIPAWIPREVFSPHRLIGDAPLFRQPTPKESSR